MIDWYVWDSTTGAARVRIRSVPAEARVEEVVALLAQCSMVGWEEWRVLRASADGALTDVERDWIHAQLKVWNVAWEELVDAARRER